MSTQAGVYFTGYGAYAAITQYKKHQYKVLDTIKIKTIDDSIRSKQTALNKIFGKVKHKLRVILGLNMNEIFMREISLDKTLSPSEISTYLKNQLHTNYFDFKTTSTENYKNKINIVAASNLLIENYLKIFSPDKFHLKAIDIDIFALLRISNFDSEKSMVFDLKNIINHKDFNLNCINLLTALSLSIWGTRI